MTRSEPPGPRDWLFGLPNIRAASHDVLAFFAGLQQKYGDIVRLRLGPYRDYVMFHPDQIREVLVTKAKSFQRMPQILRVLRQWNGGSILTTEGEAWRKNRRLVQPAFSPKRFEGYAATIVDCARQAADRWLEQIAARGSLELEVGLAMTGLTLDIIGRTMFGTDLTSHADDIAQAVECLSETAVAEMSSPWIAPAWWPSAANRRKQRAIKTLDDAVRGFIRQRRASGQDHGDLLSMLLLAVDEEEGGGRMTDEQARDESMTLMLAGHDTTAAGLTWIWHNLARHPDVQDRVLAEARQTLGDRAATAADLPRLTYCEQVVKESLRLFPPAIGVFTRQAIEDVELGGCRIPRGSLVQIFSYVTHRDPRWFPDPERFDPERFAPGRAEQIPQMAYFPFGGGPRVCIGAAFAMLEMTLVAATFVRRLQVEPAPGQGPIELLPHMSLRPRGGLRLKWTRRA